MFINFNRNLCSSPFVKQFAVGAECLTIDEIIAAASNSSGDGRKYTCSL